MPGQKLRVEESHVIYTYDGTLNGFFCCVYESVYAHELPCDILRETELLPTLFEVKYIETDREKALKVRRSIGEKISPRALELVENVQFSCLEGKELFMLRFILLGYEVGRKAANMLADPRVDVLLKAEKHLLGEAHLLLGFVRFSDYDGVLVSQISPKNFILPFIANHFSSRLSGEQFIIIDKTNMHALIYKDGRREIVSVESLTIPPPDEKEKKYRALWKQFYNTVAIEARENPRCRMTHMPKRYWENMVEVQELL